MAAGVPFERVDLPPLIPRKELEAIDIHYHRVPILAVGKDFYCDSKSIIELVLNKLARRKVPTSSAVRSCGLHFAINFCNRLYLLGRSMGGLGIPCLLRHPWSDS